MGDELDPILRTARVESSTLRRSDLESLAGSVTRVPPDEFISAVVQVPGLGWDDGRTRPAGYLEIHSGDWFLDVADVNNRRYLVDVMVAAVLVDALGLRERTLWVTRVLPAVVEVISVDGVAGDLAISVRRRPEPRLGEQLARIVHPLDFQEFVDAVAAAGEEVAVPAGGTLTFLDGTA